MKLCGDPFQGAITLADAGGPSLTPVTQEQIGFYQTSSLLAKI